MQKEIIPIVYASDENLLRQTFVSIFSVLANRKKKYFLKFYILVPLNCKIEKYNLGWEFKDYSIEYRFVSEHYFKNVKMVLQNISKPTYYRLLIALLLTEYEKCLYLDGDTICCSDICELYEIELENNFIGARLSAMINFDATYWARALEIPSADNYINAGVLIMNLQQIRLENKTEEFLVCSERKLPCQDQDVLNICCFNRIKLIPMRFNMNSAAFNMPREMLLERFCEQEIQEAMDNPAMIHYIGEFSKPWNNIQCVKGREWWEYARQIFSSAVFDEMQKKAMEYMERYSYQTLFEKISSCNQLVLFGFSEISQKFCDQVDIKNPNKIVCFCDNAEEKWGKTYKSYEVINIETLKEKYFDALVVITSQSYSDAIQKQLLEAGFDADKVMIYRKKTLNYIYSMDKIYWEDMKKDILLDSMSWKECFPD